MKKGEKVPTKQTLKFKAGQQVALYSERKGLRLGFEFVETLEKFYVVRSAETGTEHRVWFNKVFNMEMYKKKLKEIDAHNAKVEADKTKEALKASKQA